MGLLAEIQNDALNDATPVATMLRKVLVLASYLDSDVLEEWVTHELNGYPSTVDLPSYRLLQMNFKVSGGNGFQNIEGAPLSSRSVIHATKIKDIDVLKFREAIGTIDPETLKASEYISVNLMNYAHFLYEKVIEPSYAVHNFWGALAPHQIIGVVEAVRNRVLEFVLALRKTYPIADEVNGLTPPNPEMTKAVTNIYYNTIHGNVGVAGEANNSTVNFVVNQGSINDLRQQLIQHRVDEADIIDLEAALAAEPTIEADKRFGPRVAAWMGKMVGKAASGAWDVSVNVGSTLLSTLLLGYYGID
ncbi:hypothetical protein [Agrobacterium salinitolerans]|uniref:AbiTii domain-containing protein n=1 Tax=Agrobacterium salinitolerans TaxID=1183413 RepID=A0A9X3QXY3_9HYPH|nr:hypothetical protein [Agrobacterium salinitolerans]MCZ7936653.1 hypothetical protein [Agrobacterium salinitolerans]